MSFWTNIKNDFKSGRWVNHCCMAVILFNLLALAAAWLWFFDLFANFKLQYLAASIALFPVCLIYKKKWFALVMALIAAGLFAQTQMVNSQPFYKPLPVSPNLTVVQFNKYYYNEQYDSITSWLNAPDNDFDIIILNESSPESINPIRDRTNKSFPHQAPINYLDRFNDISILSKWPFTVEAVPMPSWKGTVHNVSKITLQKDGLQPVTIYAYHTQTPVGPNDFALRNFELTSFATIVGKRQEQNVLMLGDWNVTPYSPFFGNLLKTSRMNYQSLSLFPQATFPAQAGTDLLQIPIDHILYDKDILPVSITQGPSNGSDHQSLIGKFYVKTTE